VGYTNRHHGTDYQKRWYQKNKHRISRERKVRRRENAAWFFEYKRTLSCVVCGERHYACLQFHHKIPQNKDMAISEMLYIRRYPKDRILQEISKCVVLCANCHFKLHAEERGTGILPESFEDKPGD